MGFPDWFLKEAYNNIFRFRHKGEGGGEQRAAQRFRGRHLAFERDARRGGRGFEADFKRSP